MIVRIFFLFLLLGMVVSICDSAYARPVKKTSAWTEIKKEYIPHYKERNTTIGFWVTKTIRLFELYFILSLSTLLAVLLEVLGVIRFIGIFLGPIVRVGRLNGHSIVAFLSSFRNGSVGNGILRTAFDNNHINKRQLYTSVLIVSSIATLGHLPSYILAIGAVCGKEALLAVASVRIGAVLIQILAVVLFSGLVFSKIFDRNDLVQGEVPRQRKENLELRSLIRSVLKRSAKTIKRLVLYLGMAYFIVSIGEFLGAFSYIFTLIARHLDLSFLPGEASIIIPAQFVSIHSGLATVASFIEDGSLTPKLAVTILLFGSMITAPIRTMKRIIPTYVGLLGAKSGVILGVGAQVLRMSFLLVAITVMWTVW